VVLLTNIVKQFLIRRNIPPYKKGESNCKKKNKKKMKNHLDTAVLSKEHEGTRNIVQPGERRPKIGRVQDKYRIFNSFYNLDFSLSHFSETQQALLIVLIPTGGAPLKEEMMRVTRNSLLEHSLKYQGSLLQGLRELSNAVKLRIDPRITFKEVPDDHEYIDYLKSLKKYSGMEQEKILDILLGNEFPWIPAKLPTHPVYNSRKQWDAITGNEKIKNYFTRSNQLAGDFLNRKYNTNISFTFPAWKF
jgi:hypothetical protein